MELREAARSGPPHAFNPLHLFRGLRTAAALLLAVLLNFGLRADSPMAASAEMQGANGNSLERASKTSDLDLSTVIPMTFGTPNSTIVSAQSGSTALLPCVVRNIGDGMVSWIKRKDVQHLLTVGLVTYSSDGRFSAVHFHHSEDWTLQIKYVQERDAGLYECQVSTHPPTSIFLHLEVVEARAEIAGPAEKFVRPGSTLQLHCQVQRSTEAPSYLFWYHNFRMINYDVDRGVNVSTDLSNRESWLVVPHAADRHSGNYTCEASNAQPGRVLVHIFNGDNPAAMQHSLASTPSLMVCLGVMALSTAVKQALCPQLNIEPC
ncbi:zwei Ig domain protein zig-8 [Orussus abietinus]|uniref:zwei Ig domain protein zig-8 n=1 Tax=Orussus abietinus TaxID=222816 RepID=UPI000624F8AC|nr:zwei Ig domain protein zig-8 [Orussus abietinus]